MGAVLHRNNVEDQTRFFLRLNRTNINLPFEQLNLNFPGIAVVRHAAQVAASDLRIVSDKLWESSDEFGISVLLGVCP